MIRHAYTYGKSSDSTLGWMDAFGIDRRWHDDISQERTRPALKALMRTVKIGDEIVIGSIATTVRGSLGLLIFLEICQILNIRLISVEDEFDSRDQAFEAKSAIELLSIVKGLPLAIAQVRRKGNNLVLKDPSADISKGAERHNRDCLVINMYLSGYSLNKIMEHNKVSLSTLFRILRRNNIPRTRSHRSE